MDLGSMGRSLLLLVLGGVLPAAIARVYHTVSCCKSLLRAGPIEFWTPLGVMHTFVRTQVRTIHHECSCPVYDLHIQYGILFYDHWPLP